MKNGLVALAVLASLALVLPGCSGGAEKDYGQEITTAPVTNAASVEAKVKEIQDNPNIPPDAKQKAISALQAGSGRPK